MRYSHNLFRDIFGWKDKIDITGCDRAFGHIRPTRRLNLLRDDDSTHFLYVAQRRSPVAFIGGDNDGDKLPAAMLGQRMQENRNDVRPAPCVDFGFNVRPRWA
jgi:hypothetical protein